MLTLLLAGGRGLRNGIDSLFAREGRNAVWIVTRRTTRAFEGLGAGRPIQLEIDDVAAIERTVRELAHVSPRQRLPANTSISHGTRTASVPVFGVDGGYFE